MSDRNCRARSGEHQQWIRTIARKGVRFIGDVQERQGTGASSLAGEAPAALNAPYASASPTLPDKPSIAVLPFANMSGDPEQEYFSDGITEDIITALSRLRWFFVIARNSAFAHKGKRTDLLADDSQASAVVRNRARAAPFLLIGRDVVVADRGPIGKG